jgi:hypothetical protein
MRNNRGRVLVSPDVVRLRRGQQACHDPEVEQNRAEPSPLDSEDSRK